MGNNYCELQTSLVTNQGAVVWQIAQSVDKPNATWFGLVADV